MMNRRNVILGGLAVVGLGGWGLSRLTAPGSTPVSLPMGAASAQTADVDTSGIVEMVLGNPEAPVEVIEYASFTCPHCANFHADAYKQLKRDFIDTDKIRFVYREVYFDRPGLWASMIARCGGEEKFFGIADMIYAAQSDWARQSSPAAIAQSLGKIGRLAGIDGDTLDACLQDADKAQALVAWFEQNATADGIESTPSFVINGTRYKNMAYPDLKEIIEGEMDS